MCKIDYYFREIYEISTIGLTRLIIVHRLDSGGYNLDSGDYNNRCWAVAMS